MRGFPAAWAVARHIDGWLTERQAERLFGAASTVAPRTSIVEIGSHHGRSTVVLASAAAQGVEVFAVDPFDDPRWGGGPESLATFRRNVEAAGVSERVRLLRGLSHDCASAWTGPPVGLLFVDGAHDRRSVLADIDGWRPHLAAEAHVYLHDAFSSPGVTAAVLARFGVTTAYGYVGAERSLVGFVRGPVAPGRFLLDRVRLVARLGYFGRNVAIKLAMRAGSTSVPPLLGWREPGYPY